MRRIGLTGGIGSGKSTVAKMFESLGATLIDADAISRQLMEPGSPVLAEVVSVFGTDILSQDGSLDRGKLAAIVFADKQSREKLNAIMHPAIRRRSAELVEEAQESQGFSGVIIEDIPLLAETGQVERFDAVVVVYAEQSTRLRRLIEMRGMAEDDAQARIDAQATDSDREKIATWTIDNSYGLEKTARQVAAVWQKINVSAPSATQN